MATNGHSKDKKEASTGDRRLFVMRHGERCDFAFGKSWINKCFDDKGNYTQADLNLPVSIVPRENYKDFQKDSPLTEIGKFQARTTGEALKRAGVNIKYVYVSPSYRCVQTAQNVLDGMGSDILMNIEPTAFEWFGWYKNAMPNWLSPQQLAEAGFSINVDHKPYISVKDLILDESVPDYYTRCHKLAKNILSQCEGDGGDILIVAHAGSLDSFTRQLVGKEPRDSMEMHQILCHFYYCSLCSCVGREPGTYTLKPPPIQPLQEFDWTVLL